jgi:glycosyltransferase involved in cell wall biosynthesis
VLPRFVRRYLFPSAFLRQWSIDRGLSPERSRVLYNPIDTGFYRPDPPLREGQRAALGVRPDDVLVSYVGRMEANKGVVTLAEAMECAMARTPSLRALWVGFGQLEAAIERIIERSPDPSRHIRRPWSDDVRPYYAATDILALPSTGPEAFGRVVAEAQACGVPVLGSAIGGIGEAMNVGITGRLVAAGDTQAWAEAIHQLAADSASRSTMGAAGPAFVRASFHSEVIARQFEELLHG